MYVLFEINYIPWLFYLTFCLSLTDALHAKYLGEFMTDISSFCIIRSPTTEESSIETMLILNALILFAVAS